MIQASDSPYVVFDLDDVLANLRDSLMAMLNRRTGRTLHWSQWREYELAPIYGTSVEQILEWMLRDGTMEAATLEPHAWEAVEAARAAGFRTAVLTARGWHPSAEGLTRAWLARHRLAVDELHLVPAFGSKAEVLRRLGAVAHFIDDHVGHLYPARELPGVEALHLVDRPWNRRDRSLRRLHGLDEFIDLLSRDEREGA